MISATFLSVGFDGVFERLGHCFSQCGSAAPLERREALSYADFALA